METSANVKVSKFYLTTVLLLMLALPCISMFIDGMVNKGQLPFINLASKWFVFWAIGMRLFTAGIRQVVKPAFTAEDIFHLTDKQSFIVVKELGYANICMGAIGIISLFCSQWRMAAAFAGGLYMGIAGVNHIIKKPASPNEWVALISDLFIGAVVGVCLLQALV